MGGLQKTIFLWYHFVWGHLGLLKEVRGLICMPPLIPYSDRRRKNTDCRRHSIHSKREYVFFSQFIIFPRLPFSPIKTQRHVKRLGSRAFEFHRTMWAWFSLSNSLQFWLNHVRLCVSICNLVFSSGFPPPLSLLVFCRSTPFWLISR